MLKLKITVTEKNQKNLLLYVTYRAIQLQFRLFAHISGEKFMILPHTGNELAISNSPPQQR